MTGWLSVFAIVAAQLATAIILIRVALRGWRDWLGAAVLAMLLVRPTALYVTGDISRYFPGSIWSDGGDGKDQIVAASAISTLLLPVIASVVVVALFKLARSAISRRR